MYKQKSGFLKKLVTFNLEFIDWRGKQKTLGKGDLDLAQFCFDDMPIKKDSAQCILNIGEKVKKPATLKFVLESKNLDVKITEKDKERMSKSFREPLPELKEGKSVEDLNKEIESLKKKLRIAGEEYNMLTEDFEEYKKQNPEGGEVDELVVKLRKERDELENTITSLKEQLEKEINAKQKLENETNQLNQLLEETQKEMLKVKKDLLTKSKGSSQETEPSQKDKIVSSSGDLDSLLKKKSLEIEALLKENEEIKEERDMMEGDYLKMRQKAKSLEEQIKLLQSKGSDSSKAENLKLLQQLQETKAKIEEITHERDLAIRDFQNLKKGDVQTVTLEKFIIENAILFSNADYQKDLPLSLKILYLCMNEWQVFDFKKNTTFCENCIRALDYTLERNIYEPDIIVYWINVTVRLLYFFKKDYQSIYEKVFSSAIDVDLNMQEQIIPPVDPRRNPPDFISPKNGKSRFASDSELNVIIFLENLNNIINRTYLQFLSSLNQKIDKILTSIFQKIQSNQNIQGVITEVKIGQIIQIMNDYYNEFKKQGVEFIIINHFFDNVAIHIDEFLFNLLCSQTVQSGKVIQVKMSLTTFENWLEEKGIVPSLKKFFSFSRQASDVCMIAQKSLLSDEEMRKALCPDLSLNQVGKLLSNCTSE